MLHTAAGFRLARCPGRFESIPNAPLAPALSPPGGERVSVRRERGSTKSLTVLASGRVSAIKKADDGLARAHIPVLAASGCGLRFSGFPARFRFTPCFINAIPAPPPSGSASSGCCRCSVRCFTSRLASTASAAAPFNSVCKKPSPARFRKISAKRNTKAPNI